MIASPSSRRRAAAALALAALLALPSPSRAEGDAAGGAPREPRVRPGDGVTAFVGGDVETISEGRFRRGTILVRDGKIRRVGVDIDVPEGARVVDCAGKRVLPGFVATSATGIGLVGGRPRPGEAFRDSVDPFARSNDLALSAGITSFHDMVGPQRGIVSTQTAVLRPAAGDASLMVLKEPASVWVGLTGASSSDRLAAEEMFRAGRRYLREVEEARAARREPPRPPAAEPVLAALRGELPVRIPARAQDDIRAALRFSEDHGVRVVLEGTVEAWVVPDLIARRGATAIVTPRRKDRPDPLADQPTGGNIAVAAILEKAGAPFCILPRGMFFQPGDGVRLGGIAGIDLLNYNIEGAFAVRGGASEAAVLRALTLGAAEALGVADRVGSIAPGKEADLIVMDGDPLHYMTVVDLAYIGGRLVYDRSKSPLFRHLPGNAAR